MTLIISQLGSEKLLGWMLNNGPEDLQLCLYSNLVSLNSTITASIFTESFFGGYSRIPLARGNWTVGLQALHENGSPTNLAMATYNTPQQWTCVSIPTGSLGTAITGANLVYGYYILSTISQVLLWAESVSPSVSPITLNVGDVITITPTITFTTDYGVW